MICKAEVTGVEANPRDVVTSLTQGEAGARYLFEKVYCAHGEMKNRIKECQLDLFADRDDAGQPASAVVCLDGLCPALCAAPQRPSVHPVRRGYVRQRSG